MKDKRRHLFGGIAPLAIIGQKTGDISPHNFSLQRTALRAAANLRFRHS